MLRKINILPRWIIFFLDLFISASAFVATNVIIKNFYIAEIHVQDMLKKLALVLVVNAIIFLLLKSYAGIIRYSGQQDALRVFLAVLISGATLNLTTIITDELQRTYFNFSLIEIIIYTLFSLVGLITYRNLVKYAFTYFRNYKLERKQVIIYGAGEAGSMGNRVEIFIFDMGESIKISDLAKKMIRLYGLIPNQDIAITYTGLRPGEKLYEELFNDNENTLPTYHHKITIAKVKPLQMGALNEQFEHLVNLAKNTDELNELVAMMKALVPEFVSNNSVYEELDEESNQVKSSISNG